MTFIDAGNGGGLMTVKIGAEVTFLDHRETAPVGAHKNMYLDSKGEVIRAITIIGSKAAGVPGTVVGLWAAHQKYSKLPWIGLLQPAIRLAEDESSPRRCWPTASIVCSRVLLKKLTVISISIASI